MDETMNVIIDKHINTSETGLPQNITKDEADRIITEVDSNSKYSGDYHIIYNEKQLRQKCTNVDSVEEGQEISRILFKLLAQSKNGIGLSAIQVGIPKNVFVTNVKEPLYFVNAEIIKGEYPIITEEGCLSFPNKFIKTKRNLKITIKADNIKGEVTYGYQGDITEDIKTNPNLKIEGLDILESVSIQHEIDHKNGILMYDRMFHQPDFSSEKIGRNKEVCIVSNLGEEKILKYKKASPLIESGLWRFKN